jgi:hypothetical protein
MKDIVVPKFTFTAKPSGLSLTIGTFNGKLQISIFAKEKVPGEKPPFGENFHMSEIRKIREILGELGGIQPGTQRSLALTRYVEDKYQIIATLCFGVDDAGIKYIEVQFKQEGRPQVLRFDMNVPCALRESNKDYSKVDASDDTVKSLIWWFDYVLPTALILTGTPWDGKSKGAPAGGTRIGGENAGRQF